MKNINLKINRSMSMKAKVLSLIGVACASALISMPAAAHGAPDYPISRQHGCFKNPGQTACQAAIKVGGQQAIYDWNGVNQAAAAGNHMAVVPNGTLCAGGQDKFKGFDLPRNDWATTVWSPGADGRYDFLYSATAPHRTNDWKFYMTRNGWNPAGTPLAWSDLELIDTVTADQVDMSVPKRYSIKLNVPYRTGKHILFAAWQRADSAEAFYSCSDVSFGGGSSSVQPVTPSTLAPLGQVSAQATLLAGSSVKLRVFGLQGVDVESILLPITSSNGTPAIWLGQLAAKVNGSSANVRLGSATGNTVTVTPGALMMQLYAMPGRTGLSFALDISTPPAPVVTPPVVIAPPAPAVKPPVAASGNWTEGGMYKAGQVVTYQGVTYTCLQSHTAWVGTGWFPSAAGVINVLWKRS